MLEEAADASGFELPGSGASGSISDPTVADEKGLFEAVDEDELSLRDLLQDDPPESPSDRERFGRDRESLSEPESAERDSFGGGLEAPGSVPDNGSGFDPDENQMSDAAQGISCADFREQISRQTIDQVSLDISPPFRPDEISQAKYEKLKSKLNAEQRSRQWRAIDGTPLAKGALRDLAYEKVVLESADGAVHEVAMDRLGEADLAYVSEAWGLPTECLLPQTDVLPKAWTPLSMTWKASNLCHSPLYFEDVNLERYGHTRGPLVEPFVQSAHFFGGVLVLPYKMGVHSPKECIYSLGYYRPGNCAPWIVPPVPISVRGALNQTAVMVGGAWLIP